MMAHTITALSVTGRQAITVATARLAQLENPNACLPPGFSSPVSTALGWVKALGLVVAIVALIRIGVHVLRQQGDGVPDRDDTFDKLINWVVGIFVVSGALSFMGALGLSISESC